MADYMIELRRLSERGNPVGAEELIERIKGELVGDPLVVVRKRRKGHAMTKTTEPPQAEKRNRSRGPMLALATFAIILALGVIYYFTSKNETDVATPSTDLEIIEAGVAAVYSGDAERAAQLFEIESVPEGDQPLTDEKIREIANYQKAVKGRMTLDCFERGVPGEFFCRTPYHNALTDAVGFGDDGDSTHVVVENGVITEFTFPEHSQMLASMTAYLARELGDEVPEECRHWYSPHADNCVAIQLENLDGWAAWYKTEWSLNGDALIDEIVRIFESDVCQQGTIEECDGAHYQAITDWVADQE